jgi:hypothetical protein
VTSELVERHRDVNDCAPLSVTSSILGSAWRTTRATMLGSLFAAVLLGLNAVPAMADCGDAPGRPDRVADVRGETWVGRFIGQTTAPDESVTYHWLVDAVLAGDIPMVLSYHATGPGCYAPVFERGTRYLVSSADPSAGSVFSTVAWRIVGDGSLRLVRHGELTAHAYPRALRTRDIREAAAVLARRAQWHRPVPGMKSVAIGTRLTAVAGLVTRLALLSLGSGR